MPHAPDTTMNHHHNHHGSSPRASVGAAATLADVAAVARTRRARRGGCCLLFPTVPLCAAAALVTGAILWAVYTPKAIAATRGLLRLLEPQGRADQPLPPPDANSTRWTRGSFEAIVVGIAARAQVGGMAAIIALSGVALISAVLTVAGGVAERRSGIGSGSRGGGNCCSSLRAAAGAHGALAFISWLAMAGFIALFALYASWLGSSIVGDTILGSSGSFAALLQQAAAGAALADAAAGGSVSAAASAACEPDCVALMGSATGAADTLPSAFVRPPAAGAGPGVDPAARCMCAAAGLAATRAAARAVSAAVGPALAGVGLLAVAASWLYGGSAAGCARTGTTAEMAREWDKMAAEAEAVAAAGGAGAGGAFGYSAGGLVNGGNGGGGAAGASGAGAGGAGAYSGNGALEGRPPALGGGGFNGSYSYQDSPYVAGYGYGGQQQPQHRLANESNANAWAVEEGGAGGGVGGDAAAAAAAALRRAVTGGTPRQYT
jgi:hypothetical protein